VPSSVCPLTLFILERGARSVHRRGAEFAEGAQRKANSRFEISNLNSEIPRLAVSTLNPQRPLCELFASVVSFTYLYRQV
jgi:hypothetical protein